MKIKEHYNSFIPRIFKASAVTLGSHVFYMQAQNQISPRLRRHEMVHIEQYRKDGFFGFLYVPLPRERRVIHSQALPARGPFAEHGGRGELGYG